MTNTTIIHGIPAYAPRMTRADKWKKRKCVLEYFEYRKSLQIAITGKEGGKLDIHPTFIVAEFYMPILKSVKSQKKREFMELTPHMVRPDTDNLMKGVKDALFINDSSIFFEATIKCYSNNPRTVVHLFYGQDVLSASKEWLENRQSLLHVIKR